MNKTLCMFLILTLVCLSVFAFDTKDKLLTLYNNFDYEGLIAEYNLLKLQYEFDAENFYTMATITFYLVRVVDAVENGRSKQGQELALESIDYAEQAVNDRDLSTAILADLYFLLAAMYDRLIYDAKTGMKYNNIKIDYLKLALQKDPQHINANLLNARNLLYTPEAFGGDKKKAAQIIKNLFNQYPKNQDILLSLIDYHLYFKQNQAAKKYLYSLMDINPHNLIARNIIEELKIEEQGYIIKAINIGETKTRKELVIKKVSKFIGQKYSGYLKKQIIENVKQLKSVENCSIKAVPAPDNYLIINLFLSENNISLINAFSGLSMSFDYEKNVNFFNGPAPSYPLFSAVYLENNVLGSNGDFIFEFSGPHLHIEYTGYSLIDTKLYWEALLVPQKLLFYENGRLLDNLLIQSPFYLLDIALGKEFDFTFHFFFIIS